MVNLTWFFSHSSLSHYRGAGSGKQKGHDARAPWPGKTRLDLATVNRRATRRLVKTSIRGCDKKLGVDHASASPFFGIFGCFNRRAEFIMGVEGVSRKIFCFLQITPRTTQKEKPN
jgi:hypothetical protein